MERKNPASSVGNILIGKTGLKKVSYSGDPVETFDGLRDYIVNQIIVEGLI